MDPGGSKDRGLWDRTQGLEGPSGGSCLRSLQRPTGRSRGCFSSAMCHDKMRMTFFTLSFWMILNVFDTQNLHMHVNCNYPRLSYSGWPRKNWNHRWRRRAERPLPTTVHLDRRQMHATLGRGPWMKRFEAREVETSSVYDLVGGFVSRTFIFHPLAIVLIFYRFFYYYFFKWFQHVSNHQSHVTIVAFLGLKWCRMLLWFDSGFQEPSHSKATRAVT